jgi:MFS family permease
MAALAALAIFAVTNGAPLIMVVGLKAVAEDLGVPRSEPALASSLAFLGTGLGGIPMGWLAERIGMRRVGALGAWCVALGMVVSTYGGIVGVYIGHGVLIGLLGTSATFAPLVADTSMWFTRRRGIAVAICISGNYLAGTLWPPLVQHFVQSVGWRQTYIGVGIVSVATMLPLALLLARRPPHAEPVAVAAGTVSPTDRPLGMSPNTLLAVLSVAGVACCVAMAMPQVHIVAYCSDLGFGAARGAEMLSLMLACGIVSRLVSGWISDHIGGLRTLLLGSVLQGIALLLFLPFDGLVSLYLVSALFGLFQGGIIPAYTLIVREYFPPALAGSRVGTVLMATLFGMALGGWLSGAIFDWTGSYQAAFWNGLVWNALNVTIITVLVLRAKKLAAIGKT